MPLRSDFEWLTHWFFLSGWSGDLDLCFATCLFELIGSIVERLLSHHPRRLELVNVDALYSDELTPCRDNA